jgi:hypothetical protein
MNETGNNTSTATAHNEPRLYEIHLEGHLAERWAGWFEGLSIILTENGNTLLTGPVIDQAALHGLLRKVRDLGLPLLSVNCLNPDQTETLEVKQQSNPIQSNSSALFKKGE